MGEIATLVFGDNNHVGIDRAHGLARRFVATHTAHHDDGQLGTILDPDNTASEVWAEIAYRNKANLALIEQRGFAPKFQ